MFVKNYILLKIKYVLPVKIKKNKIKLMKLLSKSFTSFLCLRFSYFVFQHRQPRRQHLFRKISSASEQVTVTVRNLREVYGSSVGFVIVKIIRQDECLRMAETLKIRKACVKV